MLRAYWAFWRQRGKLLTQPESNNSHTTHIHGENTHPLHKGLTSLPSGRRLMQKCTKRFGASFIQCSISMYNGSHYVNNVRIPTYPHISLVYNCFTIVCMHAVPFAANPYISVYNVYSVYNGKTKTKTKTNKQPNKQKYKYNKHTYTLTHT